MKFTGHADYKSMKPYIDIAEKAKTDAMDAMEKALGFYPRSQNRPHLRGRKKGKKDGGGVQEEIFGD